MIKDLNRLHKLLNIVGSCVNEGQLATATKFCLGRAECDASRDMVMRAVDQKRMQLEIQWMMHDRAPAGQEVS
jgi:hypothetical protein